MSQTAMMERVAEARAKLAIADRLVSEVLLEVEKMSMDGQAFCVTQDAPRVIQGFAKQATDDQDSLRLNLGCALACLRREVQQGKNLPT